MPVARYRTKTLWFQSPGLPLLQAGSVIMLTDADAERPLSQGVIERVPEPEAEPEPAPVASSEVQASTPELPAPKAAKNRG
jgi:hypothetical protein